MAGWVDKAPPTGHVSFLRRTTPRSFYLIHPSHSPPLQHKKLSPPNINLLTLPAFALVPKLELGNEYNPTFNL